MASPNQGQSIASTWETKVGTKPEDNIHNDYWLLYNFSQNGGEGFLSRDGGRLIEVSIEYALNTTFKSYDDLETIDTTRIDVFDCAQFNWKQVAGSMVISEKEKAFTQGSGGKFDLLAGKLENAKNSHDYEINRQMHSDGTGNGSKDIGGIVALVPTDPTTGTVGTINRATWSFWRTQTQSSAKTSAAYDTLRANMTTCYNNCSRGQSAEHPTFGVSDATLFGAYEGLLVAVEQIVDKAKADIGFANEAIKFKGMKLAYDVAYPDSTSMVMGNPRFMKLAYQRGYWKKMFPPVDPANQTADVYKILTIANLILTASRRCGKVHSVT